MRDKYQILLKMDECMVSCVLLVLLLVTHHHAAAAASANSSQVVAEADALRNSGWWMWFYAATSNHCNWSGITCNEAGHVIGIRLETSSVIVYDQFSRLNLSSLPSLHFLILSGVEVMGAISDHQIGTLTNLTHLDLSFNQLTGSIPHQIGSLTKLTHLDLSFNELTGSIPHQIGSLTKLTRLDLSFNLLTGSIPHRIGSLRDSTPLTSLPITLQVPSLHP